MLADTPVRHGYGQALVWWAQESGLTGRVEAGWRPLPPLALFGFGQATSRLGLSAGAGVRVEW